MEKLLPKEFLQNLAKEFQLSVRDKQIKKLRQLKAKEGCPLQGFCPYDVNEPFDCPQCPSRTH